ncbi:MAG: 16S rRNA (guanine(527)-N(7))-methyltransferase RsmG [Acidobacteriota bacterium]
MSPAAKEPLQPEGFEELLRLRAPDFALSSDSWPQLGVYLAELDRWRRTMNLTGPLGAEELVAHSLESVLGAALIPHGERVIDIGSGAGFPGLPIAIARADLSLSLCEPRAKRAAFLRHVVRVMGLASTSVLESRALEVGGQTFDSATIRAVGDPSGWLGTAPFLRPSGALMAWTTQPEALAQQISGRFGLENVVAIPGSKRRKIALYRLR